jgi:hypothetical protein
MLPAAVRRVLRQWRWRERWLRLSWGVSRTLAVAVLLLTLACLADWLSDRLEEVPWSWRLAGLLGQLLVVGYCAFRWLFYPLWRRLSDTEVALALETAWPELEQRLLSTVQLHRAGADWQGMSRELIACLAQETAGLVQSLPLGQRADNRRLRWSAGLLLLLAVVVGVPFGLWPELVWVLLQRQFLAQIPIPRSVQLWAEAPPVWYQPLHEPVVLRFHATGPGVSTAEEGWVRIWPEGEEAEDYPLQRIAWCTSAEALYEVQVPAGARDFRYRAWLADGRLPAVQEVRRVPRPVITDLQAWVVLPDFVGRRPRSQAPYERPAPLGEIAAIPGSAVRLTLQVQKPIRQAWVETLRIADSQEEQVQRRFPLTVGPAGATAQGIFPLQEGEMAYRLRVVDEYGLENRPPLRRGLRLVPEEPPQVTLLREEFAPKGLEVAVKDALAELDLEKMPIPLGGRIRIAYACSGPYGLGRARLHFRVLKKPQPGASQPTEGPWQFLDLLEAAAPPGAGPFDLERGVFQHSRDEDQVPFYALPSPDPEQVPGRLLGGGRFDFQTTGIPDGKGGYLTLEAGDQVEYFIEVFASKDPAARRPAGRSEVRRKLLVSVDEWLRWLHETLQEERPLHQLEQEQRQVFPQPPR